MPAGAATGLAAASVALAATALAAGSSCRSPVAAPVAAVPAEGISIAVYAGKGKSYAVVDDRRTIEVMGRTILLDRIEPGAALPTLLIEPLGPAGRALAIDQCARERLEVGTGPEAAAGPVGQAGPVGPVAGSAPPSPPPSLIAPRGRRPAVPVPASVTSPLVTCVVTGKPGRYLVRVHHVAASIGFRTQHEISMTSPDRATVSTRFVVSTPAWDVRAEVVLHDGAPGAGEPPRVLGRGSITLDGGTAIIELPSRDVPSRLVHVYDGMTRGPITDRSDAGWGKDSHHAVRVMLELDDAQLLPAPAHVRITAGDDVHEIRTAYAPDEPSTSPPPPPTPLASAARSASATARSPAAPAPPKRLALWTDPSLRGTRKRTVARGDGATLADRVELSVANLGPEPRELWIEEPLRPARRREILRARPSSPDLAGDTARLKVVVAPGKTERLSFTVRYSF